MMIRLYFLVLLLSVAINAQLFSKREHMMKLMKNDYETIPKPENLASWDNGKVSCQNGFAGEYPCNDVDLLSFISHQDMGSKTMTGNDIWGWEDPETGREYAIVGQTDGTSFVDITNPESPIYRGRLPTKTSTSIWRDIKVHKNHAFIVSEAYRHGLQVFDLTVLRGNTSDILQETAHFSKTGRCHNIVINEETGFAYCVGSKDVCRGGLYMIDISTPAEPKYAGCYSGDGYVHDAQCVVYNGPDQRHRDQEVCFCYNENTLTIVNVQDKSAPKLLSRKPYVGSAYTHQGWLTEDQTHLLLDDELDERNAKQSGKPGNTTTFVWDVTNLETPINTAKYVAPVTSIDHNLYIKANYAYLSNYASGLRILDVKDIKEGVVVERGYFDARPEDNAVVFQGTWSVYPYFKSGSIIINSIERGLFVVKTRF